MLVRSSLHAVLALVVPAEIHLTLEALGTNVTPKRLEACVFPAVGDQVGALAERFATHLAFVGFFTYKKTHTRTKTVWNLHNHILDHFQMICVKKLQLPFRCFWRIRFVIRAQNGAMCFYQKDKVCIDIYGWRIMPLFRFVKHLLATNLDGIEFLLQSSAWSRKTRYANPQDICLSFFFWFISSYIILETIPAPGKQTITARGVMDSFFLFSIIKNMASYYKAMWLTGVNVRVFLHIRLLVEPLAAVLAGVRPRVRVDEQVRGESGGALEGFAAHLALEAFFLIKDKSTKSVTRSSTKRAACRKSWASNFIFWHWKQHQ